MTPVWDDVNARSQGLAGHLLTRAQLESLAREPDLSGLAAGFRHFSILTATDTEVPAPEQLERAVRRWAAATLLILSRWAGSRAEMLPLVFDDEDRRSVVAVVRGAVQHAPADRRLAGLIPTPTLPERALAELAALPTAAAVSALLTAWQHPFAAAVAPACATPTPDLFALESALAQAAALRATATARQAHSAPLRAVVKEAIDLDNARTAVLLSTLNRDVLARTQFLSGGTQLSIDLFEAAIATGEPHAAGARLATAFASTGFAKAFKEQSGDLARLDDELLRVRLRELARRARREPIGPLPVLWFALRLRAQLLDLQRIIWTVALGGPRVPLTTALTTVAA